MKAVPCAAQQVQLQLLLLHGLFPPVHRLQSLLPSTYLSLYNAAQGRGEHNAQSVQVVWYQTPEIKPSTALLLRWIARLRTETGDSDADPREVGVIG